MKTIATLAMALMLAGIGNAALAQAPASPAVPVNVENFVRAESDMFFGAVVKDGGFGKFHFNRDVASVEKQNIVRLNRDTLYGGAVFDLDAGPVTVTLPNPAGRFLSMQVIDEDQFTHKVVYGAGKQVLSRPQIGTRYVLVALRILVDPTNAEDLKQARALQDAVVVSQKASGKFEVPSWDPVSQKKVREALLSLADTVGDTKGMFGTRTQVDPVRRLIGAASAWGGNPEKDATYLNVVPAKNDGTTVYKLVVKDVPVDGFWSVSVYNAKGYYEPNKLGAYTINSLTGKKEADGSIAVQFGSCDGKVPNCLPIMKGWNYMVRLYRPRATILTGKWKFPEAEPVAR